ncbi:cytochrome P450 [Streptomyces sp. NPDC002073]|uniref:cytochrome P450 n=1 Tax=Streptomyces sp. NBC_00239 TaxID=2903640 RepID=UPI002E2D4742|nr:cytochrome P450 [Streptomyces sp. NBC_00239]
MTETHVLPPSDAPEVLPYDPFDPVFHADPYKVYEELRAEQGQVIRTAAGVAVLGYKEIADLMRDPRFGRGDGAGVQDTLIPTGEGLVRAFMFMDPPDHTRIRSLVNKVFTPRTVERVRPQAEKFAADLLAKLRAEHGAGPVDLASQYYRPLGAYVLNVLVGVPERHLERCIGFANDAGRGLDPEYTLSPAELATRMEAREGFVEISIELIEARRKKPADDLMSELVAVEQDGEKLTETELLTTAANIFLAGFSAPQAMMGLSTLGLLRHRDQLDWFRANPDKVANSVEELMRYDSAVQLANRTVLESADIAGVPVEAGDEVFLLLGAANRDESFYPNAATLDLTRAPSRNLVFGHGIHFCVAAPIARLLTQVGLGALTAYDVELLTDTPRTNGALAIRSLAELPVTLGEVK